MSRVGVFNLSVHFGLTHLTRQIVRPKAASLPLAPSLLPHFYFILLFLKLKIIKNIKFFILYCYKDINMQCYYNLNHYYLQIKFQCYNRVI